MKRSETSCADCDVPEIRGNFFSLFWRHFAFKRNFEIRLHHRPLHKWHGKCVFLCRIPRIYRINTQNVDMKVILSGGRENDGGFRFSKHSFKNLNALTLSSVHSQRKLLVSCTHEKKPKIIPIARKNRVITLKNPLHHFEARVLATSTMDSHHLCRNPLQMPLKKLS